MRHFIGKEEYYIAEKLLVVFAKLEIVSPVEFDIVKIRWQFAESLAAYKEESERVDVFVPSIIGGIYAD